MRKIISLAAVLAVALMPVSPVLAETIPSGFPGQTIYHTSADWAASSLLYNDNFRIGIGTASPTAKFTVWTTEPGDGFELWGHDDERGYSQKLAKLTDSGHSDPPAEGRLILYGIGGGYENVSLSASPFEDSYINSGANFGIGTTSTEFRLTIDNDGGIIARGKINSGDTLTTFGAGTRMIWYPKKAAFRAGSVITTEWNDENIGTYSAAMGYGTIANGTYGATAMGSQTIASGEYGSTAMGDHAKATGKYGATAMGDFTVASGRYGATALGTQTTASGEQGATALGKGTNASGGDGATALGFYTTASGLTGGATALGYFSAANGSYGSTALGNYAISNGSYGAMAFGSKITVSGESSVGINVNQNVPVTLSRPNTISLMGGPVGIGTVDPASKLEVNGDNGYSQLRLTKSFTPTATNDTHGNIGDIAWDDGYMYIKTNAGWKRTALETFGEETITILPPIVLPQLQVMTSTKKLISIPAKKAVVAPAVKKATTVKKATVAPKTTTVKPAVKTTTVKPAVKPATTTVKPTVKTPTTVVKPAVIVKPVAPVTTVKPSVTAAPVVTPVKLATTTLNADSTQ